MMTMRHIQKTFQAAAILIVLLAIGQSAWATVTEPCIFRGRSYAINANAYGHFFGIQGLLGAFDVNLASGTSQTFDVEKIDLGQGNSITITGTFNFAESNDFTNITTGSQVTLVFESSNYWFYGATVKTLSDSNVYGCTVSSISSDRHKITVSIPSGKTFGKVYLEFVEKEPMPSNTTVTVPAGDYWVSNSSHKPTPEPIVTYNGTTLTKGTDYTVSWSNNSSAGTGTVTVSGTGQYAGTATGTFTIRWAKYKVHFDKNHSQASGTMPDQNFTYNTAQTLTANSFSRNGYSFVGWSTTPDGEVVYTDQQSVNNFIAEDNATFTLYAKWTPVSYGITYDLAGGSEVTANPASYNIETASFTLNNPTRQGYTFAGWTGTGLSDVTETVTIATGSTGERSYTAHWTPTDYIISYNLVGGQVETANPTSYNIETASFTLNNPTRPGYTFTGWTGTGLGEATQTVTIETGSTGQRSYTANWALVTYNITYDLAGGEVETANPTSYNIETPSFTLKKPTRQGYYFAGWTGTDLSEATRSVCIVEGSIGDRHYTANWVLMPVDPVSYIDENGKAKTAMAIPLTGSEAEIGEYDEDMWYAVDSDITYDHQLVLLGNVHLILCDGKTMTVNATITGTNSSGYCINGDNMYLSIYGQSGGTGELTVENKGTGGGVFSYVLIINGGHITSKANNAALKATHITINDGVVMAESSNNCGIICNRGEEDQTSIIINGGVVTATSNSNSNSNSDLGSAIFSRGLSSDIIINGGIVTATSNKNAIYSNSKSMHGFIKIKGGVVTATANTYGLFVSGYGQGPTSLAVQIYGGQVNSNSINANNIDLGYTNASDYIKSGSYSGTVRIASGQTMTDGTNIYESGSSLTAAQKEALANNKLQPYGEPSVDLTLVRGEKDGVTCYWGTFYSVHRYTLPEGAAAYTMNAEKNLYRLGTDGSVIPAGVAVVIIAEESGTTNTKTIALTKSDETSEIVVHGGGNILCGSEIEVDVYSGKITVGGQQKTPYVLSVKNNTVDFYPLKDNYSVSIPAHRAYYTVDTTP